MKQMNVVDIFKKLQKKHPDRYHNKDFKKDNLMDVLNYYTKKLQVVYVDSEENVVFL